MSLVIDMDGFSVIIIFRNIFRALSIKSTDSRVSFEAEQLTCYDLSSSGCRTPAVRTLDTLRKYNQNIQSSLTTLVTHFVYTQGNYKNVFYRSGVPVNKFLTEHKLIVS